MSNVVPLPFCGKFDKPKGRKRNKDLRPREFLTPDEVDALMKAARKSGRHGHRDSTMILIAYRHALRVSELIDLTWDQVKFSTGRIEIFRKKNGTDTIHFLEGDEMRALRKLKRDSVDSPFVFNSERGGPISRYTFNVIIQRAGNVADIPFPVHPHMLRHAKGYHLVNRGEDTRAIQDFMGHKNISHTVTYTKLNNERFKGFGKD